MATLLYVASTETFVGKSAVCLSLLKQMRQDGFKIGYMKPVSVLSHITDSRVDEDAVLIRDTLGLEAPPEKMVPAVITPRVIDEIMEGRSQSFMNDIQESFRAVSHGKEIVLLEGTNTWAEGALAELTADQVVNLLKAPVLLVTRYEATQTVDTILTAQRYLSNRIVGVLINQIQKPHLDFVRNRIVPFLDSRGIPVLGTLPYEPFLASVAAGELAEHLGGQFIGSPEWRDHIIESIMIGAMGTQAGLSFFRRRANKAVFTGGDRVDLQLVALETSTNALILTGNIRPSPAVLNRAEERKVPVIVVADDTLTTVERADQLFGHVRFRQHAKLQHFHGLMEEHFDYARLYKTLGLERK
jgi:uncharacterized protein